jgi:hypothetical protein
MAAVGVLGAVATAAFVNEIEEGQSLEKSGDDSPPPISLA